MGRDNRDKWQFHIHPTKPVITADEARYWKAALNKILKIGLEFEFNLPDKNGTCKGDNNACPCKHMRTKDCWQKCLHVEDCKKEMGGKFECFGVFCSGFASACTTCKDFELDCKSCEHRYDPERNPDAIRNRMARNLTPSQSYGSITKYGVHSIVQDGSLLGKHGAEVITTGRRYDFWEFYKMCKEIISTAIGNNAYINERCSIHAHMLASYYGKIASPKDSGPGIPNSINEMEKNMPEIILANFHQLCRRYQNAITWMTMGLDEPNRMTRWEKFRVSVLHVSAITMSMEEVREAIRSNSGKSGKYGWVNYSNCGFNGKGDVSRFHVEMRAMDCLLSPSAVAAIAGLYHAMMIKAVEISRYGVAEVGDKEWLDSAKEVKSALLNNMKGYDDKDRFGDTSALVKYYDTLINESFDLIAQVKHILLKLGPAYDILEKLAERPCALRRCDGDTWEKIESSLKIDMSAEDLFLRKLSEIVDLRLVDQCSSEAEWIKEAAELLRKDQDVTNDPITEDRIMNYLIKKKNDGDMIWLDRIGTIAAV